MLRGILYQDFGTGSTYSLHKRKIYKDIRFPVGMYYEDLAVTFRVHAQCRRIAVTSERMYGYRYNPASITKQSYSPKMLDCITVTRSLYSEVCEKAPELKTAAASRAFSANRMVYFSIPYDRKAERHQVWAELKKYRKTVLFDPKARKRERIMAMCTYLGSSVFHVLFSRAYRRYVMRR